MAGEAVVLDWNFTNWVTVGLMGLVFFALAGFGMKLYQKSQGASA